ncbi:MAG: NAD(P)H-hydrate dehydratase, partial [Opitutales bacterium]|nr:NAD(P)H-hydrate dehydratase [Opitutales bacterium]
LALEGLSVLRELEGRIDAILVGPGMGRGTETQALMDEAVDLLKVPVVMDADALMPERVRRLGKDRPGQVVITPHRGEFERVSGVSSVDGYAFEAFRSYCDSAGVVGLLKGPLSIVSAGGKGWISAHGGPVLARGGSGDILAGLVGGAVASLGSRGMVRAVSRALVLHGIAADALASRQGECFVRTTSLLDYLNRIDPDYGQI